MFPLRTPGCRDELAHKRLHANSKTEQLKEALRIIFSSSYCKNSPVSSSSPTLVRQEHEHARVSEAVTLAGGVVMQSVASVVSASLPISRVGFLMTAEEKCELITRN